MRSGARRRSSPSARAPRRRAAAAAWCGSAATADRVPNVVAGNPMHWVYLDPVRRRGQPRLRRERHAGGCRADRRLVARPGLDPRAAERPGDVLLCDAARHHDRARPRVRRSQLAPLDGRFSLIFDTLEQAGPRRRSSRSTSSTTTARRTRTTSAARAAATIRTGSGSRSSTTAPASASRPRPSRRTSSCTRPAPSRTGAARLHGRHERAHLRQRGGHHVPAIGRTSPPAKVLDPGRDDYYGHSGAWTDTQDSPWLVRLDAQAPLALTVAGPGRSPPTCPGSQCTASCTTTWNTGQRLALTATPGAGAKLVRWGGACTGSGACSVTVAAGRDASRRSSRRRRSG